jgi:hypothetical protein
VCRIDGNADPTFYGDEISLGNCVPVTQGEDMDEDEDRLPLASVLTSFKFPRDHDEVSKAAKKISAKMIVI